MDRITEADIKQEEIIYRQPNKVEVYRVRHFRTQETLCMKKIFVENVMDATAIQSECLAMAYFDHPNILKLRSASLGGYDREITHVVIFMDYFTEGDLEKLIITRERSRSFFTEIEIFDYLKQLVSAYAFMQEKKVAHRDIKPQNIFVADNGKTLKVGDLGSAVKKDDNSGVTLMGTPLYLSPKLREAFAKGNTYANLSINHDVYKSDVYSLGLTMLYMISLQNVKDLCTLPDLQNKINKRIDAIPQQYNKLKPYLHLMLAVEESQRKNFIQLKDMLFQESKDVQITEDNFQEIRLAQVLPFEAKCEVCERQKSEDEIYVFTSGLICKGCYQSAIVKVNPSRVYFHWHGENNVCAIDKFVCARNKTFCMICKMEKHPLQTCLEKSSSLNNGFSEVAIQCKCTNYIYYRSRTYFCECEANQNHFICIVCCMDFNSANHTACALLFSGLPL